MEAFEQRLEPPEQRDRVIAGIAAVILLVGMPIAWLGSDTSTGDVIGMIVATVISLAVLAAVFLWLLPRERAAGRDARSSLVLGLFALVLLVVFWTGVCFGLAAGAVALGLSARAAGPQAGGGGKAIAGIALGALVMLVGLLGLLTG